MQISLKRLFPLLITLLLLIVLDFTNLYLEINNLLKSLLVSDIRLMIAKLGAENA